MSTALASFLLPGDSFSKRGFMWHVLERRGQWALVEQWLKGVFIGYNVVRIQPPGEYTVAGKTIQCGESLPSWEQWGLNAWNYGRDRARATAQYREKSLRKKEAKGK